MSFDLADELERLAGEGYAPMVLYDDNGNWCIADEGFGPIRFSDDQDFHFQVSGEAAWFRPTVREAWECYIERLRALGDEI